MGVDFTLYKVKDDGTGDLCEIKKILYLSNTRADIVANWFYRNNMGQVKYDENQIYIEIYGDYLVFLNNHLEYVLSKSGLERDLYASFFLAPKCKVADWCSGTDMFSESYYSDLEYIYEQINGLVSDSDFEEDSLFLYNIQR